VDIDSLLHQYQNSYYNLPRGVKTFLGSLYGNIPLSVRFGKYYNIHKNILEKFENGDEQYKLDFQFNKTIETLQFAGEHIPYYNKLFKEYAFSVKDFHDFSDLNKLPKLTKAIIQKEGSKLYTDKFDKVVKYSTGGSSSIPMNTYAPLSISRAKEKVYTTSSFEKTKYKYRDRTVALNARGNIDELNSIYWDYQLIDNYLLLSVNHLAAEYVDKIMVEITRWNPKFFYGYPSAIAMFIKSCHKIGIDSMPNIEGVILTSESISWEDVKLIKDFFNASVVSHYGHTERVVSAARLDLGDYSFYGSYGLVSDDNSEIIGTTFDNIVMPYINYNTQDYVGEITYYSGTNIVKSVSSLLGRVQEFIVTKENIVIPLLSIGAGHFVSFDYIEKAQFFQDEPGKVTLNVVTKHPEKINTVNIINQMEEQIDNKIDFNIRFVNSIKNTVMNKRILCIQKLDIKQYK
jgi:phenylacetate-CoA ligase